MWGSAWRIKDLLKLWTRDGDQHLVECKTFSPCIAGVHRPLNDRLNVNRKQELRNLQNLRVGTTNDVKGADHNFAEVVKKSWGLK